MNAMCVLDTNTMYLLARATQRNEKLLLVLVKTLQCKKCLYLVVSTQYSRRVNSQNNKNCGEDEVLQNNSSIYIYGTGYTRGVVAGGCHNS